jgi:hypothetical protein
MCVISWLVLSHSHRIKMGNNPQKAPLTPQQEEDLRFAEIEKRYHNEKELILQRNDLTAEMKTTIIENQDKSRKIEEQRIVIQKLECNLLNAQSQYVHSSEVCEKLVEKYYQTVLLFTILTLVISILCFAILSYFTLFSHENSPKTAPGESQSCEYAESESSDQHSTQAASSFSSVNPPMIISSKLLEDSFRAFYQTYCQADICDSSNATSLLLWEILRTNSRLPQHQIPYSSLLSLFSAHVLPAISFSLSAASVAVVLSTLGAGFSVVYFWQSWSSQTQLLVSLCYCVSFIIVGVYMHRTAKDRTLEIPAGVFALIGCLCSQLLIPTVYHLVTPVAKDINSSQSTVLSDKESKSSKTSLSLASKDPLIQFLSPFLLLFTATISLFLISFGPLGILVVLSLSSIAASLLSQLRIENQQIIASMIFLLNFLVWFVSFTPLDPSLNPYSLASFLNPPPSLVNSHYPVVSYTSLWIEFTAGGLCLLSLIGALFLGSLKKPFIELLSLNLILYGFSLAAIYGGTFFQNFSSFFYGHIGILVYSFLPWGFHPLINLLTHGLLIFTSHHIQSQATMLIGPIESLSNICLGPVGVLIVTIMTLLDGDKSGVKDFQCFLVFIANIVIIFISAQLSRSLMFVVGLIGLASCLIWFGFMRIKGQGIFIFILALISAVILGAVLRKEQ